MPGFFNPHLYEKGSKGTPKNIPQCGKCGLSQKCLSPRMEVGGKGKRRILFVGEAPGETEDHRGIPFIGVSGMYLRKVVENLGVDMDDCWITNSIICRPQGNKIEQSMIACCRPNLLKTIRQLKPNVIILLGGSAVESLIRGLWKQDMGGISRWVGWTIPLAEYGAWVCPTYHPAYLLRQDKDVILALTFKNHLKKALSLEKITPKPLDLQKLESQIEIIQSHRKAEKRIWDLSKKSGILAFDFETSGLKPDRKKQRIVSISFCLDGKDTFACMVNPSLYDAIRAVLLSKRLKKVASNIKFEERWTLAKLGCGVACWNWDTMLAAHIIDNRSHISSVKFQAFVLLGLSDYDSHIKPYLETKVSNGINRIEELEEEVLLMYNGLDSLIEYKVMIKQKEIVRNGHLDKRLESC